MNASLPSFLIHGRPMVVTDGSSQLLPKSSDLDFFKATIFSCLRERQKESRVSNYLSYPPDCEEHLKE